MIFTFGQDADLVRDNEKSTPTHSTKNSVAVQKRRARADAKAKFEDENSASFDAYGRVIRYGSSADEVSCEEKVDKAGEKKLVCKVTDYSRRQYLTKV